MPVSISGLPDESADNGLEYLADDLAAEPGQVITAVCELEVRTVAIAYSNGDEDGRRVRLGVRRIEAVPAQADVKSLRAIMDKRRAARIGREPLPALAGEGGTKTGRRGGVTHVTLIREDHAEHLDAGPDTSP